MRVEGGAALHVMSMEADTLSPSLLTPEIKCD
jgi:hypothetical protein